MRRIQFDNKYVDIDKVFAIEIREVQGIDGGKVIRECEVVLVNDQGVAFSFYRNPDKGNCHSWIEQNFKGVKKGFLG